MSDIWLVNQFAAGDSWWRERWQALLTAATDPGRRRRGARLADAGAVQRLQRHDNGLQGRVSDSDGQLHAVFLRWPLLTDDQWAAVVAQIADSALLQAQLLAGGLPVEIETAFSRAGTALFPAALADLNPVCSCPDFQPVCKHAAALIYALIAKIDADPFYLLQLRGRPAARLIDELRAHRRTGAAPAPALSAEAAPPLAEQIADFWQIGDEIGTLSFAIKEPAAPLPALQRLGQPPFLNEPLLPLLAELYAAVTRQALSEAFQAPAADSAPEENESG